MSSYRIDEIKRDNESVRIGYSILHDEAANSSAQTALATADAALATAQTNLDAAKAKWESEALPGLPVDKIEAIRRVVTLAQSAYNKTQEQQSKARQTAEPDGGRDTVAIPLADIEAALASGDYSTAEFAIFGLAEPQVKAKVKRDAELRKAYDAIGKKQIGKVVKV